MAFEEHLRQTREHVSRLDRIFQRLNQSPKGVIDEGEDLMDKDAPDSICDAGLTGSARHIEATRTAR